MPLYRKSRSSLGFSLIEIAVVLGILGFLAFLFTPLLGSQLAVSRYRETRGKLEPLKSSIISFVASNQRLPCPAVESLPSTDANYGIEASTPGTCAGTTSLTGGGSRGVIPWKTLGLSQESATDGFGRFFTYAVTTSQTNLNANRIPGITGVISMHNATPVATSNQINTANLAVFVLISHGLNGNGGFMPTSGSQMPLGVGNDELENSNTTNIAFVDKGFSDIAANPYDDVVMWVVPQDLLTLLAPSGYKTPQGAMTEKLQATRAALLAYVTADNADPDGAGARVVARRIPCAASDSTTGIEDCVTLAGVSGYVPWAALGIPSTTSTDPWGRALRYVVDAPGGNAARLLKNATGSNAGIQASTGSNRTVTFKSDGPDGIAGTTDDVTQTTTASELAGALLAANVSIDP